MPDPEYTFRGAWATATAYVEDDLVSFGSLAYVCLDDHTSDAVSAPPNDTFWDVLVEAAVASLAAAYATPEEYRAQVDTESSEDDLTLDRELIAISRIIDRKCRRALGFNRDGTVADEDEVARVYTMGRGRVIDLDDHVSISAVAIGNRYSGLYDAVLATTAYALLPRNAVARPDVEPYRQIEFLTTVPGDGALVRVTGIGGWPEVPGAVKTACIELAAILRIESPRATNKVNEMNQVLSTSRVAQNILEELLKAYGPRSRVLV